MDLSNNQVEGANTVPSTTIQQELIELFGNVSNLNQLDEPEEYDENESENNPEDEYLEETEENILDIIEREEQERIALQKNIKSQEKEEVIIIDDNGVEINKKSVVLGLSVIKNIELSKYCTITAKIESFKDGYSIKINDAFLPIAKFKFFESNNTFQGTEYLNNVRQEKDILLLEKILNLYIDKTFGKMLSFIETMGFQEGEDYTIETPTDAQCHFINGSSSHHFFPRSTNEFSRVPIFIFQLRFKNITLTNKYGKRHIISDIIYQLAFLSTGHVILRGTNAAMTNTELSCNFTGHPHFQRYDGFTHVCLGSGAIGGYISSLSNCLRLLSTVPIEATFNQLIAAIMSASQWEDVDGGPYFRIEQIVYKGNSNNNNNYSFNYASRDSDYLIAQLFNNNEFKIPIKIIQDVDKSFIYTIDKVKLYQEIDKIINIYPGQFGDVFKSVLNDKGMPISSSSRSQTMVNPFSYSTPYVWKGKVIKKIINVSKLEPDTKEIEKLGVPIYFKELVYHKLVNDLLSPRFCEYVETM